MSAAAVGFLLFALFAPFIAWRCGYLLLAGKRGTAKLSRFRDHLFYLGITHPTAGINDVPFGKGYDYFTQSGKAKAADIARCQLSGLKLLFWAEILNGFRIYFESWLLGFHYAWVPTWIQSTSPKIPSLTLMVQGFHAESSVLVSWLVLYGHLMLITLTVAIFGHRVIACFRLFGFDLLRNTYKPLLAQSVVDFWNRYYYYFKELLVEFFFFPVYLNCFRMRPKLRMFVAVMAAAFLGNLYFHAFHFYASDLIRSPLATSLVLSSRAFYSFLLGIGIYISIMREQKRRGKRVAENQGWGKIKAVRRIAGVWTFFAIIQIWNVGPLNASFQSRTEFFLSLLGF